MKIITAIASTTHVDKHFEQFTKEALESMAKQIKQKYIPFLVDHDFDRQIGMLLYGEVFQLADGEYALGVVSAYFETPGDQIIFQNEAKNIVWKQYKNHLNISEMIKTQASAAKVYKPPNRRRSDLSLSELLEIHLDSTQITPSGQVNKIKKLVATVDSLRIEVYPKDHEHQPHFHVISRQRGINARFDLNTLQVISMKSGKITQRDIKKIQNFFESQEMLEILKNEHSRLNK